jgi:alpha-L-fucosidase 2
MKSEAQNNCERDATWRGFMRRHDLHWERMPTSWRDGAFLGNGMLGVMVQGDAEGRLCLELGRSDVCEHRPDGDVYDGQHRLRIGRLRLHTRGRIVSVAMRLNLWNAELVGRLRTDAGTVRFRIYTHAVEMVIRLEWTCSETESVELEWEPEPTISPHVIHRNKPVQPEKLNPAPRIRRRQDGTTLCAQDLLCGGQFTTAWRTTSQGARHICQITIANSYPAKTSEREASDVLDRCSTPSARQMRDAHRKWWHEYYPSSVVKIPDRRLESFYWIQIYKLASATRADRQVIDLMGPWPAVTVWPGIWWNLNIQLCYYPVYTANRLELGESLCRFLDDNLPNFILNVPEAWRVDAAGIDVQTGFGCRQTVEREFCNLAWTCHNYWLQYRYSMDESLLDRLYPLLSRSMNMYWHLLKEEADGKLHIPRSRSPEYGTWAEDTTINLALIHWGCETLLWMVAHQQREEPLVSRWQTMLDRVVEYPVDGTGLMIGRDVPMKTSHRHYSHLLMIYPLYLMTWDQPEHRDLIERSLRHWIGLDGALQGYTFSGAASIFASIGNGNEARDLLNQCLDRYIQPNTLYCEWDSPVMETPLSVATSVQEMLLQSWGGVIRVMPAIPDDWDDVQFESLRAEGAFLVWASRRGGQLRYVRVQSLAGATCVIEVRFADPPLVEAPVGASVAVDHGAKGMVDGAARYRVNLAAGESVVLRCSTEDELTPATCESRHPRPTAHFGLVGAHKAFTR